RFVAYPLGGRRAQPARDHRRGCDPRLHLGLERIFLAAAAVAPDGEFRRADGPADVHDPGGQSLGSADGGSHPRQPAGAGDLPDPAAAGDRRFHEIGNSLMSAHAPERLIRLENAFNVRDLGGYALAGGGETAWRAMLRGDGLHRLGENDVARLLDNGLRTVIDLRSGYELEREPNPFRAHPVVRYHNIALFDALSPIDIVLGAQGSAFELAARYRDAVDHCSARIVAVLEAMVEADEGAILFHCSAGKDRTGLVAAILLVLAGVDDDQVLDD